MTLKDLKKLKIGQLFKVIANKGSGHGCEIGTMVTVSALPMNGNTSINGVLTSGPFKGTARNFLALEIELCNESKQEIENSIKDLQKDIAELNQKLVIMNELDLDIYDEDIVKTYNVMKTFENKKMSSLEKAKAIAALIKG